MDEYDGNSIGCDDVVFRASVVSEINLSKKEVSSLGQELKVLKTAISGKCNAGSSMSGKPCYTVSSKGGKSWYAGITMSEKSCFVFVRFGCVCVIN